MNDEILSFLLSIANLPTSCVIIGFVYCEMDRDVCILYKKVGNKNVSTKVYNYVKLVDKFGDKIDYNVSFYYLLDYTFLNNAISVCDIYDYGLLVGDRIVIFQNSGIDEIVGINLNYEIIYLEHHEYVIDYTEKNLNMLDNI